MVECRMFFFPEISLTFTIFTQYQEDSLNILTIAETQERKIPCVQQYKLCVIRSKLLACPCDFK